MPSNETRFAPWFCSTCGYLMDAASGFTEDAVPTEGDVSSCLNCGGLHTLHGGARHKMTLAERAALPRETLRELTRLEIARRRAVKKDLSRRSGRA